MRQRAMIALAIAPRPELLLADEPTTALDVTVQEQVLDLLQDIQSETGMAMILVSHDIGVIARACDKVAVMYAGYVVERGRTAEVLSAPRHPYTVGLLAAVPRIDASHDATVPIVGQPPNLAELPTGCPFAARCAHARRDCQDVPMTLGPADADRASACPFF
jgi:oligopeptide/dipeptide ABC transporter ATP-binding protein